MKDCVLISVAVLVICFTAIAGAPVKESEESTEQIIKNTLPEQEENELDNLAEDEDNIERLQNLAVQKSQSIQYTNDNGNQNMISEIEKQVIKEPENLIISDVKQTIKQKQSSDEQKPHISTKTEIDVPDKNIHETIEGPENDVIEEPILNETPTLQEEEEVARYLLESQEFPQFDDALDDLVQSAIISPEEAIAYKDNVLRAYNDLEDQQELEDMLYPDSPMNGAEIDVSPPFEQLIQEYEEAVYPDELPEYDDGLRADMDLQRALGEEMEMNDIVRGLLGEWVASATDAGDRNSEEILNILLNYITRGRDRDEVEEAKNILAQLFSEVLMGRELEEEEAENQDATHNAMQMSNAIPENTPQESNDDTNTENETPLESLPKEDSNASKMTQTKHSTSKRSSELTQTGERFAVAM